MPYFIYNDGTRDNKVEKHDDESPEHWQGTIQQYADMEAAGKWRLVDTDDPSVSAQSQRAQADKLRMQTDRGQVLPQAPAPEAPYVPSPETQAKVAQAKALEGDAASTENWKKLGSGLVSTAFSPGDQMVAENKQAYASRQPSSKDPAPQSNGQGNLGSTMDLSGLMQPPPAAGTTDAGSDGGTPVASKGLSSTDPITQGLADTIHSNQAIALRQKNDLEAKAILTEQARLAAFEANYKTQEIQAKVKESVTKDMNAYRQASAEAYELSKQKIDPGHFWNSRSDGQKAASFIAAAFMGFGGTGQDYMQEMQALVTRDIQLQAADLDRRRKGIEDYKTDRLNLVELAKKNGLDDISAIHAATEMKWGMLQHQLSEIDMRTQGMEKGEEIKKLEYGMAAAKDKAASDREHVALQNANLAAQVALNTSKANRTGAGGRGGKGATKEETLLDGLEEGLASVTAAKTHYAEKVAGVLDKVNARIGGIPGVGDVIATDAKEWDATRGAQIGDLERYLTGRTTGYATKLYGGAWPEAKDNPKVAEKKFDALIEKFNGRIRTLKARGVKGVSELSTATAPAGSQYPGGVGAVQE